MNKEQYYLLKLISAAKIKNSIKGSVKNIIQFRIFEEAEILIYLFMEKMELKFTDVDDAVIFK